MAVIYYPKNQLVYVRDQQVSSSNYESILLQCNPNVVFYFDTSSYMQAVNASQLPITASWAMTASVSNIYLLTSSSFASSSYTASYLTAGVTSSNANTSSYTITASYALNGGGGGGSLTASAYVTYSISPTNWVTISFTDQEAWVDITNGARYNFTCSNVASASQVMTTTLFINNTATATSSFAFPSDWVFMGITPTTITSSKSATLTVRNYGGVKNVAAYSVQF